MSSADRQGGEAAEWDGPEIEAVARVFADHDGYKGSKYVPEVYFPLAEEAIIALDAVRSSGSAAQNHEEP